jgi:hypothetical protein
LDYLSLPLTPVAGTITTYGSFEILINILKFEQYHPEIILMQQQS